MKASDAVSDSEGQVIVNAEGQQYTDAKSYIMLEFTLQRPLVPKRQPEELAQRYSIWSIYTSRCTCILSFIFKRIAKWLLYDRDIYT